MNEFAGAGFYSVYVVLMLNVSPIANTFAEVLLWIGLFLPPFSVLNSFQKYLFNAANRERKFRALKLNSEAMKLIKKFLLNSKHSEF